MVRNVTETTAEDIKSGWGELLQAKRETTGETQMQLAVRLGCDTATISRIERGKGTLERFMQVAKALNVELIGGAS